MAGQGEGLVFGEVETRVVEFIAQWILMHENCLPCENWLPINPQNLHGTQKLLHWSLCSIRIPREMFYFLAMIITSLFFIHRVRILPKACVCIDQFLEAIAFRLEAIASS